jgi:drug/metabolite transporter (DMT)-like permease
MRVFAAGTLLLLWCAATHQRLRPARGDLVTLAVSGALLWLGGNGLVVWAEQTAHSGYAALLVSSAPLWAALIESLLDRRLPTPLLVVALLVGLAGVGLLTLPSLAAGSAGGPAAIAALLLAALTWSIGSILQQRRPVQVPPLVSAAYQLLLGGVAVACAALVAREPLPQPTAEAWLAWAYLVVVGSLVGFTSYVQVLRLLPTPVGMTYAYVNPVIAVLLGAILLEEPISIWTLTGMALVLVGVAGVFRARYHSPPT